MVVGRSGGRVGEAEVKTNSAQLKLGLGLSLAIRDAFKSNRSLKGTIGDLYKTFWGYLKETNIYA